MTRFECPNLLALVRLRLLHGRVGRDVRRHAAGFLGVRVVVDWPTRVMLSISLWEDLDSVYSMGDVPRHIVAARAPGRLGVRTTSGVFCFAGDWRDTSCSGPRCLASRRCIKFPMTNHQQEADRCPSQPIAGPSG
jgi:hypothetical protein